MSNSPTFDMAYCGPHSPTPEVFVCFWVHHQQPGLVSPFLYEGHHVRMTHALDVDAVYLEHKGKCFHSKEKSSTCSTRALEKSLKGVLQVG